MYAGPAGSPVVPVPKRPRTESSAVARANAALFLLDTAVVSPSFARPLAGSLQRAQQSACAAGLGADIRRAVQARLGLPPGSPTAALPPAALAAATPPRPSGNPTTCAGDSSPRHQHALLGSPAAKASGQDMDVDEAAGVVVPVNLGDLLPVAEQVGTPPAPRLVQLPSELKQPLSPPEADRPLQQWALDAAVASSPGAADQVQAHAGLPPLPTEAAVAKGGLLGVRSSASDLQLPTPLKLPLIPAAAARDRPDSAGPPF